MSRWGKVVSWIRGQKEEKAETPEPLLSSTEPSPEELDPVVLGSEQQQWLEALASDVALGQRIPDIGSPGFWNRVNGMWRTGDERLSAQLVEKFISIPLTPDDAILGLRTRLVEMFEERGDLSSALDHLAILSGVEEHTTRANYLLAEHYRRRGDEVKALRHYELVLARKVDYPNVKIRVDRLRSRRGQATAGNMGETIVGPEAQAGGSGTRYRLVRELGRGATGVVYLARDAELERDVAIKLLHPHLSAAERRQSCARFFAEARIAASLRHPNIMAILDIDERARRIVLELAAGGTLRSVLRDRGARSIRRALERHVQILSALGAAHRRGIVHRDLKPANLMFRRDPDEPGAEVILGDFGVAHLPDVEGAEPESRDAVGTLAYMAPEQRRNEEIDPKWDLYAAAAVFFEMVVGQLPWSQQALLRGIRKRGDFTLPETLTASANEQPSAALLAAVQAHLDDLGDPDPSVRPDTEAAVAQARELRDFSIAESAA